MATLITRRHTVQLGAAVLSGWAVGQVVRRTVPIGEEVGDPEAARAILRGHGAPASGPRDASVRLAVFTDYRCPACRRAYPALAEAVHEDGDVRLIYKEWPLFGPASRQAARVALAADDQGIYPAVHRRLMTVGRTFDETVLRDAVVAAGGDWTRLTSALATDGGDIEARLHANARDAFAAGLPGTPAYLTGSFKVVGALDADEFGRLFKRVRAATR